MRASNPISKNRRENDPIAPDTPISTRNTHTIKPEHTRGSSIKKSSTKNSLAHKQEQNYRRENTSRTQRKEISAQLKQKLARLELNLTSTNTNLPIFVLFFLLI